MVLRFLPLTQQCMIVCGLDGPIVTLVRALMTPQPLCELQIKSAHVHHKEVKAALGVKLVAPDLDKAVAGSQLLVVSPDDGEEALLEEVMSNLTSLLDFVDKSGRGVCVQASTCKIPVFGINIGPVHKKDVMRAATMLEKAKELAKSSLRKWASKCSKVSVSPVTPLTVLTRHATDIIYHLFDAFTAYNNEIMDAKRRDTAPQAVWPWRLKIIAAFCKHDLIMLGVDILDGALLVGTPICVVTVDPTTQKKQIIDFGKV
ncbi:hypothetical protein BDR05DRAFT_1063549 [Suillus weaverae]|nr:hypothetical protein BDR05DRAFT_1063549 [Suillus weaverae]